MTTTQTPATGERRGSASPAAGHHEAAFLAEMNRQHRAGIVNVDNAADRLYSLGQPEYDGPRCGRCENTPVEDEGVPCADCLTEIGDDHWACPRCPAHWYRSTQSHEAWAARLPVVQVANLARHDREAAAVRTSCPTCHGAGGWQQPDGLIIECPRGCMTADKPCDTCSGVGTTDDGDRLCPECRGRAA